MAAAKPRPAFPKVLVLVLGWWACCASGWLGGSSALTKRPHVASTRLQQTRITRRQPSRASNTRCVTAVRSMILGETPIIEATGLNSRRISASIVIQRPPEAVWRILTDYDNLATHVPNLVISRRLPHQGIRLYQEGAQKIFGFDFSAALTMDMEELFGPEQEARRLQRKIKFWLVESKMLSRFDGEWALQPHSRKMVPPSPDAVRAAEAAGEEPPPPQPMYTTKLIYSVNVTPKGVVPVPAIEWRIKEDVPTNLRAVKQAVERLPLYSGRGPVGAAVGVDLTQVAGRAL